MDNALARALIERPAFRQMNESTHSDATCTFAAMRLHLVNPSRAGNVQMRPWRAVHKLLEKFSGRDGPRLAIGGGIAQIAHVTLHWFKIFRIHRQWPKPFAAITSLRGNGITKRLVISEQSNSDVAQRDAYRTGERGSINDMRGTEPRGIGLGIGQPQPTFGIGVDHLDRLAIHSGDDIARTSGRAAGHVFRHD